MEFSQRLVPAGSVQLRVASRRTSGNSFGTPNRAACPVLKALAMALSTGPFCCGARGAVSSRRIPRLLQYSSNMSSVYSVPLSVQKLPCAPMSATDRFTNVKTADAFFSLASYGRWRRDALSMAMMTYRDPQVKQGRAQRCRYGPVP